MEPSPPPPVGSVAIFPSRGPAPTTSSFALQRDPLIPHQQSRRQPHHHHAAKVSPRHVKLQSVHTSTTLPAYATTTLHDQLHTRFRHELFQLHQVLQDAVARCSTLKPDETPFAVEIARSRAVLDVLTSDHHAAVMREFFRQWQHLQHTDKVSSSSSLSASTSVDEQELLCHVVDLIFRNLPTVLTENDVRNAKGFMRFLDTLKTMRDLVLSLLYKTFEKRPRETNETKEDPPVKAVFASTSALLAAIGGPKPAPSTYRPPTHQPPPKRVPLYLYCQQLEREVETLTRRLSSSHPSASDSGNDFLGVLHEQTLALLVQFWELPKHERLAFFCQIASQAKPVDCDAVLKVFLDKCDTTNLLSLWDALHVAPHLQHALAMRKRSDDAEAATREAAQEAEAVENGKKTGRHRSRSGSDSSSDGSSDDSSGDEDTHTTRGRQGKRFAVAARGGYRPSLRHVDLGGLTEVFERGDDDDDDDETVDGGGGWGSNGGGKRRRRKLRIHDRGRTPDGHRSRHDQDHSPKRRTHREDPNGPRPDPSSKAPTKPATPTLLLDRLHANLLELLKVDDPTLDGTISDAAWKLVETIDRRKNHDSVVPRGSPRKLSTFQQHAGVSFSGIHSDPLGTHLSVEQQYGVKLDQLHSLLASLNGFSVLSMSSEAVTSASKRLPGLLRLFQGFQNKVHTTVGLDPVSNVSQAVPMKTNATTPPSAADASMDDQLLQSVEIMLGKLGKMVRSLAPMADVGSPSAVAGVTASTASSEILQLAEAMEELASAGAERHTRGAQRHHLSLDPARRMAMLSRLKSLAQGTQIESLTGLLSSTSDDVAALKAVADHQQRQLQEFTVSQERAFLTDDVGVHDGHGNVHGDVEDVLKLVKKAKTRRASAKLAAVDEAAGTTDNDEEDDDDQSLLMNPMTAPRYANRNDISLTIKQASTQRGSKLFNAGLLLRVVDQMYREHYETMVASLQYGSRRMEFSEFMYDWHIRKYGLKSLAQQHLLKLIQSLRKHERKVFPCHLCLRFLGVLQPLGFHAHKFVLGLLDKWSGGTFAGAAKHRVEYVPRQFKVRIAFALATIQDALGERFGVYFRTMDAVTSRIKSQAMRQDDEFIKEADVLSIAIDEWQAQRERIEQILQAVYAAGDVNGDGALEYDEFSAVMLHLSPTLADPFMQRVFTAAHDYLKPRRISFERFLDVVLLERVLNTNATTKAKAAGDRSTAVTTGSASSTASSTVASSVASSSMEDEEIYQFNLLQETWEHDREGVAQALSTIPHAPTVASIQFRVTFLTQILSKRVDSKTAWMCHRQIMREIRRYQNLDDDQIVAVKTKEESFKKAVNAIRNLQRLNVAFRRPTTEAAEVEVEAETETENSTPPRAPSMEEDAAMHMDKAQAQTQTPSSYVSVVEGLLDNGTSSLVDMEALEDQLREKFLERADEGAIDDFKNALETIRRVSVQAFPPTLDLAQLRATYDATEQTERALRDVHEDEEDEDEEDEEDESEDEGEGENNKIKEERA